jgi:pimeloyl-ACP methyl ester carboxylesterase
MFRRAVLSVLLTTATGASAAASSGTDTPPPGGASSTTSPGSHAEVRGQRLYYQISGQGPNLLLLHGGLNSGECFAKIVPALSERFRVITVDRAGHGRSSDSGEPFVYASMAEETKSFLDLLGISSTLVLGWSDGGVVGYHLASRYPGLVTKLVAVGANTRVDGMAAEAVQWLEGRADPESLLVDLPEVAADYRRLSPHPEHLLDFLKRSRDLWLRDPYITPDELTRIECPVLLIAGDRNDIRVEHLLELRASLKRARLCILPGASHFVMQEKPHLVLPIILDFLQPTAPAR